MDPAAIALLHLAPPTAQTSSRTQLDPLDHAACPSRNTKCPSNFSEVNRHLAACSIDLQPAS
jgi:hypothetical protein